MRKILVCCLLLLAYRGYANTVGIVHFNIDEARNIHCEPLLSMNVKPEVTQSGDTTWINFGRFRHDIYPFIGNVGTMKNYYMIAGPDTTILDMLGQNNLAKFYGQKAKENGILYTMYTRTGMYPFDADVTYDKLITIKDGKPQIYIDVAGQQAKLASYFSVLHRLPLSKDAPGFIKQLEQMGDLAFRARMLNTYLLLTDHKYELPDAGDAERAALYGFVDSIAEDGNEAMFAGFMPYTLLYAQLISEYHGLKANFEHWGENRPLLYFDNMIRPGLEELPAWKEPGRSLLLLFYLKKVYENRPLRDEYYQPLMADAKLKYPETFDDDDLMLFYSKAFGIDVQRNKGQQVDGELKVLNRDMQSVTLNELVRNKKGLFILTWASWCGHCDNAIKTFNTLQEQNSSMNFISISIDRDSQSWLRKKGINAGASRYLDTNFAGSFVNKYQLDHVPQIICVGPDLKITSFDEVRDISFYKRLLAGE